MRKVTVALALIPAMLLGSVTVENQGLLTTCNEGKEKVYAHSCVDIYKSSPFKDVANNMGRLDDFVAERAQRKRARYRNIALILEANKGLRKFASNKKEFSQEGVNFTSVKFDHGPQGQMIITFDAEILDVPLYTPTEGNEIWIHEIPSTHPDPVTSLRNFLLKIAKDWNPNEFTARGNTKKPNVANNPE